MSNSYDASIPYDSSSFLYNGDTPLTSSVSGSASVNVSAKKIQKAKIVVSITSSSTIIGGKIWDCSVSISPTSNLSCVGTVVVIGAATGSGLGSSSSSGQLFTLLPGTSTANANSSSTSSGSTFVPTRSHFNDSTYSVTINGTGYKFFGTDLVIDPSTIIFANSNVSVTAYEILHAVIYSNASVSSSISGVRVKLATSSITIDGAVVTVGKSIPLPRASINITSNASSDSEKVAYASVSISISSEVSFTARKTYYGVISASGSVLYCEAFVGVKAEASLTIEGYKVTVAQEILYPLVSISASATVNVSAYEILYSSSTNSSESNAVVSAYKIATAEISYSGETSVSVDGTNIKFATATLTGTTVTVTIGYEIQLAKISILSVATSLVAQTIKFSSGLVEDTESIRTMLLLNNKPLTEHNRTLDSSIIQSLNENTNWSSRRSRYYRSSSGRKTFNINWRMVPNNRRRTADLKFGRDFINSIGSDPDSHTLKVINLDSNNTTPYTEEEYTVIVKSYSESLIRRDETDNSYWWDCNLTLEEV